MNSKQIYMLIFSIIFLGICILFSGGIFNCEKIVWDEGSEIICFVLNRVTGKMNVLTWDKDFKTFRYVKQLSKAQVKGNIRNEIESIKRNKRGLTPFPNKEKSIKELEEKLKELK